MLFNSNIFIFIFLPLTLAGFYFFAYFVKNRLAIAWLILMSCIFYAYSGLHYLILLIFLIIFNYFFGVLLSKQYNNNQQQPFWLFFSIVVNVAVLFYFKYTNFAIKNINYLLGANFSLLSIIIPVGISFFIFQKIAFLIDAYRGNVKGYRFADFCLFVVYFPQLIAGPIVHHQEFIPQLQKNAFFKLDVINISGGIILFVIGLSKKILLADQLALWVTGPFHIAQTAASLNWLDAWGGALSFTLQIYFDFSAYTDMALGLALMMGLRLPLNFDSPYKAHNIIDFWHRWHMTLSRFLRDYIYVPLGGNRRGTFRGFLNLMLTMLIGGLWHGAAWTFLFWGLLHGCYLMINHAWVKIKIFLKWSKLGWVRQIGAQSLTFIALVIGWVFFRAQNFKAAFVMVKSMLVLNNHNMHSAFFNSHRFFYIFLLLLIVFFMPNSQQICDYFKPALQASALPIKGWWKLIPFWKIENNTIKIQVNVIMGIFFALILIGNLIWQLYRATPLINFIYFKF